MYILDTDHLSLLERNNADSLSLQMRMEQVPPEQLATTIINYEEQMRGWMERTARAQSRERLLADELERLQKAKIRVGTMDLKIASIALANGGTVLTRNLSDFGRIPGLKFEDWSL